METRTVTHNPIESLLLIDGDGDGYMLADDCDDTDVTIHPSAKEINYNGVDDDCDSATADDDFDGDGHARLADCDDKDPAVFAAARLYTDKDGDGFAGTPGEVCVDPVSLPENAAATAADCDDGNPAAYPGAAAKEPNLCTVDGDGDGYGGDAAPGGAQAGSDCLDSDAAVAAATGGYADFDGDGHGGATYVSFCGEPDLAVSVMNTSTDCNDANPLVAPGAYDSPDDIVDADCSGADLTALIEGGLFVDGGSLACPGDGSVATPYCALDAALAAATDGTVIYVAAGHPRSAPLTITKAVTIIGGYQTPNWARTLDPVQTQIAGGASPALLIDAGRRIDVALDGVAVSGFTGAYLNGIKVVGGRLHLEGVTVATAQSGIGAGLLVENSDVMLAHSFVGAPSSNSTTASRAVYLVDDGVANTARIVDSSLHAGVTSGDGVRYALYAFADWVTVSSSLLNGGAAVYGNAVYATKQAKLEIVDTIVRGADAPVSRIDAVSSGIRSALGASVTLRGSSVFKGMAPAGAALDGELTAGPVNIFNSYLFASFEGAGTAAAIALYGTASTLTTQNAEIAAHGLNDVAAIVSNSPAHIRDSALRVASTSVSGDDVSALKMGPGVTGVVERCVVFAATAAPAGTLVDLFKGSVEGEETCTTSVLTGQ